MNWRRGLFRAWIVFTVIWLALASYFFNPVPSAWALDPVVMIYQGQELEFPSNTPRSAMKKAIVSYINDTRAKRPKNAFDQFDKTPEQEAEDTMGKYQPFSIWPGIFRFLGYAIVPPLMILAAATVMRWVFRGFGADSN